jgi:hydrogenase-4 component F
LHTFAKSAVFFHIGQLYRVYATKQISKMGRYMNHSGLGTVIVILAMMCITAMPPSGLFITELLIFKSMADAHMWITMVLTMILLTIIVWAIGRDTFSLLFLHAPSPDAIKPRNVRIPWHELTTQILLIALAIWFGLSTPQWLSALISNATIIAE